MSTYTYAILTVSQATFSEIEGLLTKAGYTNAFLDKFDGRRVINMSGLALAVETPKRKPRKKLKIK
jgi:hypothetical protein